MQSKFFKSLRREIINLSSKKYTGIKIDEIKLISSSNVLKISRSIGRNFYHSFVLYRIRRFKYGMFLRNISMDPMQRVAMTKEREDGATKRNFLLARRIAYREKQAQMGKTAVLNARDISLWGRRITRCSRQRSPIAPPSSIRDKTSSFIVYRALSFAGARGGGINI